MLPIFQNPMRLICRTHLLLTTALISLAPLPFGADMARAQMYLDNADPGGTGPYQTGDGDWGTSSDIWNDGAGNMSALPTDGIGVLTSGGAVTLNVIGGPGPIDNDVEAGGLRVFSGDFTLTGGRLLSGAADDSLSFLVTTGNTLTMVTEVVATNINVLSTGDPDKDAGTLTFSNSTGTINNAGRVWIAAGTHTGDVVNNNTFIFVGDVIGNLTNNAETDPTLRENRVTVAGNLSGTLTNSSFVRTDLTGGSLGGLTNNTDAIVNVVEGTELTVGTDVANSGTISLNGGTLDADVTNAAGSRVTMSSTGQEAILDGNLVNGGQLAGNGTITGNLSNTSIVNFGGQVQGDLTNTGTLATNGDLDVGSLTNTGAGSVITVNDGTTLDSDTTVVNSGTIHINTGATLDAGQVVENTGTMNIAGSVTRGLENGSLGTVNMTSAAARIGNNVTNLGTMNTMGEINGSLNNRGTVVTSGNTVVNRLVTGGTGTTTIAAGHTMTSTVQAWNYATTNIAGTLSGSIHNTVDPNAPPIPTPTPGTLRLQGGTVTGSVDNDGTMLARGTVGGLLDNSSTLDTTGDLQVGALNNSGTTQVTGGTELTSVGAINNSGTLNAVGDITLLGISRLTNTTTGTLTMNGGDISGSVINNGMMDVNANTEITGSLTNGAFGTLMLNSLSGEDITLTIADSFTNRGTVDGTGTGALTIATGNYINAGGTVANVNIVGNLQNESVLIYSEDSFLNGNLTNTATGDVTVSAALDMNNNNITNRGDFIVTSDADSDGNVHSVRNLVNQANFTIETDGTVSANSVENSRGGIMNVAGTLNSVTQVDNIGAIMNISGLVNADGGLVNRSSATQTGVINMTGGTIDGTVDNRARLGGNGSITGLVTNYGTVAPVGTLTLGGGLVNHELVDIAASGVLRSATAVQNYDRVNVAGRLEAGLNNYANATLAGGTIAGAVVNRSGASLSGTGTIDGTLLNRGEATLGGNVTGLVTNQGRLTSDDTLQVAGLTNSGTLDVAAGSTLQSATAVQNGNLAIIRGNLQAALTNDGTTRLDGGTITGAVTNRAGASLTGTGTIVGTLGNAGTATIGGRVTGMVTNSGTLTSADTLRVAGLSNSARLNVATGSTLRADTAIANSGTANIGGAVLGGLVNTGSTVLAGGSVDSLTNNAGLTGTGTVGTLANADTATIGGRVDTLTNTGTLVSAGTLGVGALTNDGLVRVATGSTLSMDSGSALINRDRLVVQGALAGQVNNFASATMSGGTLNGSVVNSANGTFSGTGTVTGTLFNNGMLRADGALTVGQVTNNAEAEILAGGSLTSDNAVDNNGTLSVAGRLAADLANAVGARTTLAGGTIIGTVDNSGTLSGTGTISGRLANSGVANIGGTVTDLANLANGTLTTTADLRADDFRNDGVTSIATGTTLTVTNTAVNSESGYLAVAGRLDGSLTNDGRLAGAGEITGPVTNSITGTTSWTGRMGSSFTNRGTASLGGTVAGALRNEDGGTLTTTGNLSATGPTGVVNAAGGTMIIAGGSVFSVANGLTNEDGGALTLTGEMVGTITNAGTMRQTGLLTGSLATSGSATLNGTITGNLVYQGGNLATGSALRVGGDFRLEEDYSIGAGREIRAARTVVTTGTTLALQGALDGALLNAGTVEVRGNAASVSGLATNNGLISLSDGSGRIDTLTVGGLAGDGTYRLDVNTRDETADSIVIAGGAATGNYTLELNFLYPTEILATGNRLTLIDVDETFGDRNRFTVSHNDLPPISERIVYSVDGTSGGQDVTLVAQTNPAIGALFGNVALTQSLIGSVINRPTSPFVTALAYEDKARPCGIGSWGRITGGHANATGSTDNGVSSVEAEVNADYRGMQVGTDIACFDDRFGGWDMAFGVLGGINRGDTNQPVYAIDPNNSQNLTGTLTSYTSTDFEQRYVGVYMTATRGRVQADLQYRLEKTDFTIENKPLAGYTGLGLDETDFSSDGYTVSGSLSYGIPVGESGWAVVPTVGFAWSEMSTDSIPFGGTGDDAGYRLTFKDSTRKIGFVGATVAKTFVQPTRNAALSTFATATWYNDFADPTISVFSNDNDASFTPQELESDNLGAWGEISIGANWIKVLGPKSRGRQISAGARVDARFGDQLDSVGVSGQFRWQF